MDYSKFIKELQKENYTAETVHDAAEKVFEYLNIKEIPVPIVFILQKFGFKVYQQKMEDRMSGYIAVDSKLKERFETDKVVVVNSEHNPGHKRFTMAHELGHYLLDYKKRESSFYNAYFDLDISFSIETEKCANQFAANLLMPKDSFIDEFNSVKDLNVNIQAYLADKFKVSAKAIEKRMEELKLGTQ